VIKNKTTTRKKPSWKVIATVTIIALATVCYAYSSIKTSRKEAATVVARVNGQPIYESEVNRGIVSNSFDSTADDMKQNKLQQLVSQLALKQFLDKHNIKVNKKLVDKEIDNLEKNPPSKGCACCTYPDLNSFLEANGITIDDLRGEIEGNIGLNQYAKISWKQSHPTTKDVMKVIGEDSKFIRKNYIKGWQIFFNTFQQTGDQQQIEKTAAQNADKAWKRLQSGESFENVAKSMSEDMTSKHKGGYLGIIDGSTYGQEVQQAICSMVPGIISKPIHSSFGYHIIKYEPMTDADVVKFCESYLIDQEKKKLNTQIMKDAKVEIVQSTKV